MVVRILVIRVRRLILDRLGLGRYQGLGIHIHVVFASGNPRMYVKCASAAPTSARCVGVGGNACGRPARVVLGSDVESGYILLKGWRWGEVVLLPLLRMMKRRQGIYVGVGEIRGWIARGRVRVRERKLNERRGQRMHW